VPYDPTEYRVQTTECRVYDDYALSDRMFLADGDCTWLSLYAGYVHSKQWNTLIPKPTEAVKPFHYVSMVWKKI
jgi:hypothetical protein